MGLELDGWTTYRFQGTLNLDALLPTRPTQADAEAAVRTLIEWAGDDPAREGLKDTPARVARSYRELFSGYETDPAALLQRTFEEVEGYDEIILLRDIRLESYCEHHMVPIIGRAHVAYLPDVRVVGISKLARVVGCVRQATPNPGEADRPGGRHDQRRVASEGCRRRH